MRRVAYPTYTGDFKSQAEALSESIGRTKTAPRPGILLKPLANWAEAARAGHPLRSRRRKSINEPEGEVSPLRAENAT